MEMKILYHDKSLVVCIKPGGVLSTDGPGGLPDLVRAKMGLGKEVRTVHRLDQVVSGLMVLAVGAEPASALGKQIMERTFEKEYLAVIHGRPPEERGTLIDLLARDKATRRTYVAETSGKGVQEAVLDYELLGEAQGLSLVAVTLRTGRTHQIRAQFSARGLPLVGDRKYSTLEDRCEIALWSRRLAFDHPVSGVRMQFTATPPRIFPWSLFEI